MTKLQFGKIKLNTSINGRSCVLVIETINATPVSTIEFLLTFYDEQEYPLCVSFLHYSVFYTNERSALYFLEQIILLHGSH